MTDPAANIENSSSATKESSRATRQKDETKGLRPTPAFIGAAWTALGIGLVSYCIALFHSELTLTEKGFYFTLIIFGLFSAISVQKCVRDRAEGIPVTDIYYGLSWFTTIASITLLVIGLRHADMYLSEKGFYGMAFTLSLFSCVAIQKNVRDVKLLDSGFEPETWKKE